MDLNQKITEILDFSQGATAFKLAEKLKSTPTEVRHALVRGEIRGEFCIARHNGNGTPVWSRP